MKTFTLFNFPTFRCFQLSACDMRHTFCLFSEFDTCETLTPYFQKINSFYFVNSTIMNSMINVGFVITTKYNHIDHMIWSISYSMVWPIWYGSYDMALKERFATLKILKWLPVIILAHYFHNSGLRTPCWCCETFRNGPYYMEHILRIPYDKVYINRNT